MRSYGSCGILLTDGASPSSPVSGRHFPRDASRYFGREASEWREGQRAEGFARAVAAYVRAVVLDIPRSAVALTIVYRGQSSLNYAVAHTETPEEKLLEWVAAIEQTLTC